VSPDDSGVEEWVVGAFAGLVLCVLLFASCH